MTRTIIVPLDTSSASEASLPVAEALAHELNGRMVLLSVIEAPSEFAMWLRAEATIEAWVDRQFDVDQYLVGVAKRIDRVAVETQVSTGHPVPEIAAAANDRTEPVIVMASEVRTGLPRISLGSVTVALLQASPCPMVVVRSRDEAQRFDGNLNRLLVALDGSEFAERALSSAQSMLGPGLVIHLVRVVETSKWYGSTYAEIDYAAWDLYIKASEQAAREYLEALASDLEEAGHQVTWEVRDGLVADQIADAAESHRAGLIVMSTHGRTGLGRMLIGSVAERVIHDANRPVLLVSPEKGS